MHWQRLRQSSVLEEQALDPALHDRVGVFSGVEELDEYLHRFAVQQSRKGVSTVHVLVDTDHPSLTLGYYTLSAAQVGVVQLSELD